MALINIMRCFSLLDFFVISDALKSFNKLTSLQQQYLSPKLFAKNLICYGR